jgi:hypothetical protein
VGGTIYALHRHSLLSIQGFAHSRTGVSFLTGRDRRRRRIHTNDDGTLVQS